MKLLYTSLAVLVLLGLTVDSEASSLANVECHLNIDCLHYGLYFECTNGQCVKSKHKICRSDADCKKNILHRHCKNYRCS